MGGAVLVPRFGRRVLTIGFLTMMVGAGLMALTVQLTGLTAQAWQFLPAGFVFGIGGGLAIVPVFSIILAGVSDREVGSASGLLNALQQLGGTIGVAVSGTLFFELLAKGRYRRWRSPRSVAAAFVFGALVLVQLLPRQARDEAAPGPSSRRPRVPHGRRARLASTAHAYPRFSSAVPRKLLGYSAGFPRIRGKPSRPEGHAG